MKLPLKEQRSLLFKKRMPTVKLKICLISLCFSLILTACRTSPDWVRDPYTRYNKEAYLAVVGRGSSSEAAESNALDKLAAYFGAETELYESTVERYQEVIRAGIINEWSESFQRDFLFRLYASIDSPIDVEIGDQWDDGVNYYAVAILNKARVIQIYSGIVKSNQEIIENLLNIAPAERNSLNSFARYQFGAAIADMTAPYVNLLSAIDAPPVQGVRTGASYRLDAYSIASEIPINIRVNNDRSERIIGAFARTLSSMGFRINANNSRYMLDVNVTFTPVVDANSPNSFYSTIDLSANLVDINSGTVLLPFILNNIRKSHTTQLQADNRALWAAARRIDEEYASTLGGYLFRLLPEM